MGWTEWKLRLFSGNWIGQGGVISIAAWLKDKINEKLMVSLMMVIYIANKLVSQFAQNRDELKEKKSSEKSLLR